MKDDANFRRNFLRTESILLDDVEVRASASELRVGGRSLRIKPKPMRVLVELIAARGRVVSKDQIMDRVWPNMAITDRVLTEAIHELRRALEDDAKNPRYIQTIPRKGYRLVARVQMRDATASTESNGSKPRIAVTGFESLSDEPDDRYFCEGLSEELINSLGKFKEVEVLARTSTFGVARSEEGLRELSQSLGVTHLVYGTLRQHDNRIRVIAHLIDARTGTELWSHSYDRKLENIISVQDEIAQQISRAVVPRLDSDVYLPAVPRHQADPEAFRRFSKGRYFWKQDNSNPAKAMSCYEEAIRIDSEFAASYAGLVECYNTLGVFHLLPQSEAREASTRNAEQAIFLDPDSPESLFAFGYTQFYMRWNWTTAESAFRKCLAINPIHAIAHLFLALLYCPLGHREASREHIDVAINLDPFSPLTWWIDFLHYHYWRDFEQAIHSASQGLELAANDTLLRWALTDSLVRLRRRSEALSSLHILETSTLEFPLYHACAGILHAMLDRPDDTIRIAGDMGLLTGDDVEDPFICGLVSIYLGETERALDMLERAGRSHDALLWVIACEPYFDPLRRERRFNALLERLDLRRPTCR